MTYSSSKLRRRALFVSPFAAALVLAGCTTSGTTDTASDSPAPATSSAAASPSAMDEMKDAKETGTANDPAMDDSKKADMKAQSGYVSYDDYKADPSKYAGSDVVLFFNASWCPTCQEADKSLKGAKFPDGMVVVSVDYDQNTDLKQKYGVTYQHTYVQVDENGKELKKFTGSTTVDEIKKKIA